MSYDLFLKPKSATLTVDDFESYFRIRPYYTLNSSQAFYENEDTGVYFSFDYAPDEIGTVSFNLNYYRPHYFGLEAAPEVGAFIAAFDLTIDDPQTDGMGEGPFSVEGFLRGWNSGNRLGYRAILSRDDRSAIQVYPTGELERIWRWNLNRAALQTRAGEMLFVPKFMFFKGRTQAHSAVVWTDACPIFMPKADIVIVLRDELSNSADREVTVVEWSEIQSVVNVFPVDEVHGHFRLDYEATPASLARFVRALPIVPQEPDSLLSYDSVLNAELVLENTTTG